MTCARHVRSIPIIIGRAVCKRHDLCRKFVRPLRERQACKAVVRRMGAKISHVQAVAGKQVANLYVICIEIANFNVRGARPSTDVLARIANALEVSAEYLLSGNKDDLAENTLNDKELLKQFKELEQMEEVEKNFIKKVIDALITKNKLKQLAV